MEFDRSIYYGHIVKAHLTGAMDYLKQFPEQESLYGRFVEVFVEERYPTYEIPQELQEILLAYWRYYRNVFYLQRNRQDAAERLRLELLGLLNMETQPFALEFVEESLLTPVFRHHGFCFQGGRTGGYYGPYVWNTTATVSYDVELPQGTQVYTVKLLEGFVMKSWLDCLSFGEVTPGGWTDGEGIIHCMKDSYDFDSENFRISLLKHEAQHARDLRETPQMSSEDLEYRAKLVELIYSSERNLLERFAREADNRDPQNGHAMAASRILEGFSLHLAGEPWNPATVPVERIQAIAKMLFETSNGEHAV